MTKVLDHASGLSHVMEFTRIRCLESTFALIRKGITNVIDYNDAHPDFHLSDSQIEAYMTKWVIFATIWGVGGSMNLLTRTNFGNKLNEFSSVAMPSISNSPLIDYEVRLDDQ
jgi:dynein heavy chain 1